MAGTQQEIARLCGVSRSTVATILAGKFAGNYKEETRRQVLEMAQRLNYRPNRQARTLKTGKSGLIGIVHTGIVWPVTHRKIAAVVQGVRRAGLEPLVYHNTWFDDSKGIVDALLSNKVQGVVLINNFYEHREEEIRRLSNAIPCVQFSGIKVKGIPLIAPDKPEMLVRMARYLAKKGYKHLIMMASGIGDVPALNPISTFQSLFNGPKAELAGLRHDVVTPEWFDSDREDGYAPGARALEQIKGLLDGPAAVIAANDQWAIGLYLRCLKEGLRVPEDLGLTGFDNSILGQRLPVALTSAEEPIEEMGIKIVELLTKKPFDGDLIGFYPYRLMVRESSG